MAGFNIFLFVCVRAYAHHPTACMEAKGHFAGVGSLQTWEFGDQSQAIRLSALAL